MTDPVTAKVARLTHLDEAGDARMVDVGDKPVTSRSAHAVATVVMSPATAAQLVAGRLPKGDVVAVARIAGIQAAKRTWELIPLCHQLALSSVDVEVGVDVERGEVAITAAVRAADRTGVEMEALVAVTVAALTVYDMVKGIDRGAEITDVRLIQKTGGKSGDWTRPR